MVEQVGILLIEADEHGGDFLRGALVHLLHLVRVLHAEVVVVVERGRVEAPGVLTLRLGWLKGKELGEVGLGQRMRLGEMLVELVVPHLTGWLALAEEEHHRLHPRSCEHARRQVEHRGEVALREQLLAQGYAGVVGVAEERVLDDDARATTGLEHLDEVLQEHVGSLAALDGEVLLNLLALGTAKWRVGADDADLVAGLDVGERLGEGVRPDDVRLSMPCRIMFIMPMM